MNECPLFNTVKRKRKTTAATREEETKAPSSLVNLVMMGLEEDNGTLINHRSSLKSQPAFTNYPSWKHKLRENCFKRVRQNRTHLLWKFRLSNSAEDQSPTHKDNVKSTLQDIFSDELRKIKESSSDENSGYPALSTANDDMIWEYDGLHTAYQGDCEEILLEMQKIFYEDLRTEETTEDSKSCIKTWEDEEDEYLSRVVYEHMQLNSEKAGKEVWCPICKQGELQENGHHILCRQCELKIKTDEEVNLKFLQLRLGEAHDEHLDRGCRLRPQFCIETKFGLIALYIKCQGCDMFEVVL